ncbi:hypothetical protein MMC26_002555 [Xylographa opegraphella]|nr:hypothetical protein [Xylographa opegraphella]
MSSSKQEVAAAPDLEILSTTLRPGGYVQDDGPEQNVIASYASFRQAPLEFLKEVSLHVSGTGWRSYDYIIGQPVFYQGFSENMKNAVMSRPMLQARIRELAGKRLQVEDDEGLLGVGGFKEKRKAERREELEQNLEKVAADTTDNMICKMESKRFIRGAYYFATQLLTRAYHQGIHVSSEEVIRLRDVAANAATDNHSIIFLPCHRSHVDYVSLQVICYRLGISLPTVVAGDNLALPGLKQFLQSAGAMWIRRSFAGDALYTTIVQSYIDTLLQMGMNIEAFIEGGRSRTGKLLSPKFGILSFIMDAVISGRCDDAIICPVSTQYDKVIETEGYVSELLGQPKPKENLMDLLSSSSVLSLKLGRVDVRFHKPWSLKTFIAEQQARMNILPQQVGVGISKNTENKARLLRTMGYRVLSDINSVSVVMPTALVGCVLLTLRGRGVGMSELVRRVDWLCDRVRGNGGRVAHFNGIPTSDVVQRAIEVLGPDLVNTVDGLLEPTYYAVDRFQLSFYRNQIVHLFISESVLSLSLYTTVKRGGGPSDQLMSYAALYKQAEFLSQLFRGEFIFPTEGLRVNLLKTLHGLEADSVITVSRDPDGTPTTVELSDQERQRGREDFDFYCFLIWPFCEASWLGAVSLLALTPPKDVKGTSLQLNKVQDMAQLFGKTLYHQGDLSYFEAVNKETLKNAYQRFEEEGIILVSRSRDSKVPATIKLSPQWTPSRNELGAIKADGRLWDFTENIALSRREGKNRRDGATVSTRVLALADKAGQELYMNASFDALSSVSKDVGSPSKRRRKEIQSKARL